MDPIRVTLKREEVPVTLVQEDETERQLVLREMTGKERDKQLQSMSARLKVSQTGNVTGIKSYDGLQASLLARCLYDEQGDLVPIKEIQAYPAKTQAELFEAAQEINGLTLDAEDDAKND